MRRQLIIVAAVLGGLVVAPRAGADDTAAADALFNDGKALRDEGRYAEACPKFEASFEISRALGTLLSIADCREKTGQLATALTSWESAMELAKETADDRLAYVTERHAALAPKVPKLGVDVKLGAEKLSIVVGGEPLPESKWGLALPVDPGSVDVEVKRGGAVLDKQTVQITEGSTRRLSLDLDQIAKAHPRRGATIMVPADPAQKYAGVVVLSVGLAGLATFGILEGVALGQRAKADAPYGCVDKADGASVCSPDGYRLVEQAGTYAEIGQWIGVAGLATAAVGLTVFLTAPSDAPAEPDGPEVSVVAPWVSPVGAGLVVGGAF